MSTYLNSKKTKVLKCVFVFFLSFLAISCGPPYDGDRIIDIENEFFDSNNNPIAGLEVKYEVGQAFGTDDSFKLETDENGKVSFSTFYPKGDLQISVNDDFFYGDTWSMTDFSLDGVNSKRFYVIPTDEEVFYYLSFETNDIRRSISNVEIQGIGNVRSDADNPGDFELELKINQQFTISYTVYNSSSDSFQDFTIVRAIGVNDIFETIEF